MQIEETQCNIKSLENITLETKTIAVWFKEEINADVITKQALKASRLIQLRIGPSHCPACRYRNLRLLDPFPHLCRN